MEYLITKDNIFTKIENPEDYQDKYLYVKAKDMLGSLLKIDNITAPARKKIKIVGKHIDCIIRIKVVETESGLPQYRTNLYWNL